MIRVQRSLADPADLAATVARAYRLEVTGCVLLRSLVNDVYRIDTPDGPRLLKLYRAGHHTAGDVAWEVRLAAATGGLVAPGVPDAEGDLAGELTAPEGVRPYAMWAWAPGTRPEPPFGDELYRRFGAAAARFHAAADTAAAAGLGSRPFHVEEAPVDEVLARLGEDDRDVLAGLVEEARRRVSGAGLERGICHGDLSLDNLHVDGDRIVLYDLDLAGDYFRAGDLVGAASTPHWGAFRDGYLGVRGMDFDLGVLPWLEVLGRVSELHFHLVGKPALRGAESAGEGWVAGHLTWLRTMSGRLVT